MDFFLKPRKKKKWDEVNFKNVLEVLEDYREERGSYSKKQKNGSEALDNGVKRSERVVGEQQK